MKFKVKQNKTDFEPITLELKIETIEELESLVARLNLTSRQVINASSTYKCTEEFHDVYRSLVLLLGKIRNI